VSQRVLILIFCAVFCCIFCIIGCNPPTQTIPSPYYINMLANSSFALENMPSFELWNALNVSLVQITPVVPPFDGTDSVGTYSVAIRPGTYSVPGAVFTDVPPGPTEYYPYILSVWAKSIRDTGTFFLDVFIGQNIYRLPGPNIIDTVWHPYFIADTAGVATYADSLRVWLAAGSVSNSTSSSSVVYFNYPELLWGQPPQYYGAKQRLPKSVN